MAIDSTPVFLCQTLRAIPDLACGALIRVGDRPVWFLLVPWKQMAQMRDILEAA